MFQELLPADGVWVPTEILYNKSVPEAIKTTWMQMRGLAGEQGETPRYTISLLCTLTGKGSATIYGHLKKLRDLRLLCWRSEGQGRLVISFPDIEWQDSDLVSLGAPDSKKLENNSKNLESSSLKLNHKANHILKEGGVQKIGKGESQIQAVSSDSVEKTAAQVYREVMHLTANGTQRQVIDETVSDLVLWRETLKYWLLHNWNPMNVPGLLDLYARGGPKPSRRNGNRWQDTPTAADDEEQYARDRLRAGKIIAEAKARQAREWPEEGKEAG